MGVVVMLGLLGELDKYAIDIIINEVTHHIKRPEKATSSHSFEAGGGG
jgi:hypothetical protein